MLQIKVGTFLNAARSAWILSGICCAAITSIEIANANAASINVSSRVISIPRNRNPRSLGRSSRFAGTEEAISRWRSFMRRNVIGTLRILNLIPLASWAGPVLPAKASAVQFFSIFFVGFLETFRIPSFYFLIPNSYFRLAPSSLLHAPLRALSLRRHRRCDLLFAFDHVPFS
jgi:hypothetical protein